MSRYDDPERTGEYPTWGERRSLRGRGDYAGEPGKTKSPTAATLSKSYGGVNGAANICKQSSAFIGPDNPAMFGK